LKEAFSSAQQRGVLTAEKFNEALICLEFFNCKRLRDTPLGHRMFKIFDLNNQNTINE